MRANAPSRCFDQRLGTPLEHRPKAVALDERFADRRIQGEEAQPLAQRRLVPLPLGDVPEDQHAARRCRPARFRIGAALSSIGRSVPSFEIRTVWLASPTILPSLSARSAGFSTGWRVSSLTMRNTSSSVRPDASPDFQPTNSSATGFRKSTRPVGVGADDGIADARQRDVQPLPLLLSHLAGGGFLGQASSVLLGELALGQVPGDFGKPTQFALLVLQRRDDDVRPKLRAVLADPPALVLEPPSAVATFSSWAGQPRSMASCG